MYQIDGKLSDLDDPTLYVVYESPEGNTIDTVLCDDKGHFSVLRTIEKDLKIITVYYDNREQWFTIYPERGTSVHINGEAAYPQVIQVKGGRINNKLSEFKRKASGLLKKQADLFAAKEENEDPDSENASKAANINLELKQKIMDFIKSNPDEEASAILISDYIANPDDMRQAEEAVNMLSPELDKFYIVKDLKTRITKANTTMPGVKAPDFKVVNIYGTTFTPDSFANKYYILAFTALWCDMCQTEVMQLDRMSTNYSRDSLEILLISLDDETKNVREVVLQDSIKWNLVTDSAGQAINMFEKYNVSAVPRCFLIDKEGIIILRTSNGLELKQAVDEIMN